MISASILYQWLIAQQGWVRKCFKMRASFLVIGALLAREGYARVSMLGGCAIGTRQLIFILKGLKTLGADVKVEKGICYSEG